MILSRSEGPQRPSLIPPHALSLLTMFGAPFHDAKQKHINKIIALFLMILEMKGFTFLLAISERFELQKRDSNRPSDCLM